MSATRRHFLKVSSTLAASLPLLRMPASAAGDTRPRAGDPVSKNATRDLLFDRADLPRITQPLLLLRSAQDHVVEPESSRLVLARISSTDVTEIVLEDSYHVATLDNDAERIFAESLDFIRRIRPTVAAG